MSSARYPFRAFADLYEAELEYQAQTERRQRSAASSSASSTRSDSSSREPSLVRWATTSTEASSIDASASPVSILRRPSPASSFQEDLDESAGRASKRASSTAILKKILGRRIASQPAPSVHFAADRPAQRAQSKRTRQTTPSDDGDDDDALQLRYADEGLSLHRCAARSL